MRAIDYFDKGADACPDRDAIIGAGGSYSYREAREISIRIARAMWVSGLAGEEPAAIYSPNDAQVLLCMLGVMRAGAVWVPLNYRSAIEENIAYLNYVGASWLFYHPAFGDVVDQIRARVPTLRHLIRLDREVNTGQDAGQDRGIPSLKQFMERAVETQDVDWADPYGNNERLVGIFPTGGTTGPGKGVGVTNRPWGAMTEVAINYWHAETAEPVCLSSAPLSHAAGVVAFTMFALGATNVVMPRFDPVEVLRNIERFRITHLFLPPTAYYDLLSIREIGDFDYSSLRIFLLAGSPVSPDKFKRGVEVFGPCMCQCYGQTESPMLLTWLDPQTVAAAAAGEHPERLRSCGKATFAVRLGVLDQEGKLQPPNVTGEIVARGAIVAPGYYNLPEATAEIRTYGWHHTGDVGYQDEHGYLYIVDRKKNMIVTGGFNVFCAEVEAAIVALPQIRECAVIGVPDDRWGEAVKAIVVLAEGQALAEDAILTHCKTRLGGVKTPKSVDFISEIPKTPAGKIDRKKLREPFWAHTDRDVH
jgi:fatty-acyl-CoA synthase